MSSNRSKFPSSLEDTISQYKNKYLVDLDDENDDIPLIEKTRDTDRSSQSSEAEEDQLNLRIEHDEDSDDQQEQSRGVKSRLPRDLAGLMGQANVSFARGDINDAILMC